MTGAVNQRITEIDSTLAASLTGVSLRQINHWDSLGVVCPSVGAARGSGSRRRFAPNDLLLLAAAGALRQAGASLESIRAAISAIRNASVGLDCPPNMLVVLASDQVRYLGPASAWPGVSSHGDECLTLLNLGPLAPPLRNALARQTPVQVRTLRIGEVTFQVTVEPDRHEDGFRARLKARSPLTAAGPTPEAAMDALRQLADAATEQAAHAPKSKRAPAARRSDGASAWGGGW